MTTLPEVITGGTTTGHDAHHIALHKRFNAEGIVNVKVFGALGDGTTDDTAAIQAAIDAAPVGSTVWFPAGIYLVSAILKLRPWLRYLGSHRMQSVIRQANVSLTALAASQGWYDNETVVGYPIIVQNLGFDGNRGAGATGHGLLLMVFASKVIDCWFANTGGDGLRLTSVNRAGSSISTSAVENVIAGNDFQNVADNADCIRIHDPAQNKVTDGWITDNVMQDGGQGINVDAGTGWEIAGNHVYGSYTNGIVVTKSYGTRVRGNYVENYGRRSTPGEFYNGLTVWGYSGGGNQWPISVSANVVLSRIGASGTFFNLVLFAHASEAANFALVGNTVRGHSLSGEVCYAFQYQSGGSMSVTDAGNQATGATARYVQGAGVAFDSTFNAASATFKAVSGLTEVIFDSPTSSDQSRITMKRGGSVHWYVVDDPSGDRWVLYDGAPVQVVEVAKSSDIADGQTPLLLLVNHGGTRIVQRVTMGAADSGGSGYRALRVPNS